MALRITQIWIAAKDTNLSHRQAVQARKSFVVAAIRTATLLLIMPVTMCCRVIGMGRAVLLAMLGLMIVGAMLVFVHRKLRLAAIRPLPSIQQIFRSGKSPLVDDLYLATIGGANALEELREQELAEAPQDV